MNGQNAPAARARVIGGVALAAAIVAVNALCTQFLAARLAYAPALGRPLLWHLYQPFAWWDWLFSSYRLAPTLYNAAFLIFAAGVLIALVAYVLSVGLSTRSARQHSDVHGTARFATLAEVRDSGLLPRAGERGEGVYCGGYLDPKTGRLLYLRHNGPEHLCAVAPTRSGKGVGLVVPTLLSWPHSVFVLDRKGENYAVTAGWRHQHADNVVLRFDPAEPAGSCAWNALAEIRFGTRHQVSDAQNIAP
jgi:type IV secretion system protein VirD4